MQQIDGCRKIFDLLKQFENARTVFIVCATAGGGMHSAARAPGAAA